MSRIYNVIVFMIFILGLNFSCQSEYDSLIKTELKKGVQKDSLLFGVKFGDTKSDFFERCKELNKKGLITQGPSNQYAQYYLKTDSVSSEQSSKIIMLFYATNRETGIINGMDMKLYYSAWAPWNKQLYNNQLLPIVKDSILNWFPGNNFIEIDYKKRKTVYIKIDGNRQIKVFTDQNQKDVSVIIENLNDKYNAKEI